MTVADAPTLPEVLKESDLMMFVSSKQCSLAFVVEPGGTKPEDPVNSSESFSSFFRIFLFEGLYPF